VLPLLLTCGKQLSLLVTEIIEEWALASVGQFLLKGSNWMYAYPKTEASKGSKSSVSPKGKLQKKGCNS
jgi:hypothetical protein